MAGGTGTGRAVTIDFESLVSASQRLPAHVLAVWLFGSVARGTETPRSDVDIAVFLGAVPPATLEGQPFDLQFAFETALGVPVDLVVLNGAPVDLVHRVLRDGRLLLDRDRGARIRFEVKARNEYFDLLPILEEYRRPRPERGASGSR